MMAVTCVTVMSHDLLLYFHCTVVPGGAFSFLNLRPLKGGPFFFHRQRSPQGLTAQCDQILRLGLTLLNHQTLAALVYRPLTKMGCDVF
jgi:hypothetical protein